LPTSFETYSSASFSIVPENISQIITVEIFSQDKLALTVRVGACSARSGPASLRLVVEKAPPHFFHKGQYIATRVGNEQGSVKTLVRAVGPAEISKMGCQT
jgi:hypothetical protein